jgi:hypothetical protein
MLCYFSALESTIVQNNVGLQKTKKIFDQTKNPVSKKNFGDEQDVGINNTNRPNGKLCEVFPDSETES